MTDPSHDVSAGLATLIPFHAQDGDLWVDARLLHIALGVNTRVNDWVNRRLADALAVEGQDYYSDRSKTPHTGRPPTEWYLTVDMAMHFCMLERSERGRDIRQYFIDTKRRHLTLTTPPPPPPPPALPTDPLDLLELSLAGLRQNKQEIQALNVRTTQIETQLGDTPITQFPEQEARIHKLCQALGKMMPGGHPAAYRQFKAHFGRPGFPLAKYSSLPTRHFEEAERYLVEQIQWHQGRMLLGGS
ncbi:antA/AntB antirepressor family protein [Deinococcus soli (ex Cha et al. 2016)]|uniref:antA/AntB antirepressor family protein n=1 Tax=Deinococcus soli (ex Cha et al. 2016) TaxID=1309411 RepID=UPI00166A8AC7|nr:antA/AntB antirepressor family protein [Deinococcus soli (ex Cha et al. 2016)]GGB69119.1 hypothetical protein GCM10008019_26670 [Deinococcus soli (ex Cha et al. 2016)]